MANWDVSVGESLLRQLLHDKWGGGRYGGMEPAVKADSVFLFTKPEVGSAFGYVHDGWHSLDGTYHYTGDGQVGDQSLLEGGNRALMRARELGRAVRLFRSHGTMTTYVGEFELGEPPYYRRDAPDKHGETRSVLVFRLTPRGNVLHHTSDETVVDILTPQELPPELVNVDEYAAQRPDEPFYSVRREAHLVQRYVAWLKVRGEETVRHRVPIPSGGHLFTDLFNKATDEIIEAKASASRVHVRAGLGQILDYSRFVSHERRSLLLPVRPSDDLVELLHHHDVGLIWEEARLFHVSRP